MYSKTVFVIFACFGVALVGSAQEPEKLNIVKTYDFRIGNAMKPGLKKNFIAGKDEWNRVYRAFFPDGRIQPVDFEKHLVLVSWRDANDPNQRSVIVLKDAKGVVSMNIITTDIGFKSSNETIFSFYVVPRTGVTGVQRYDPAQQKMVVDPIPK